ncbi:PKD domain-containing protein [Methanosarcina sp. UBA5]|uniref:PKD domain-containing protein n=1 Tax=Methanosarcina sp. UBA5 TaxID=1915593 RepID=UPI0025FDAE97|nr:PKD domain-containing protein [Methanosarcina sp. UBA5]
MKKIFLPMVLLVLVILLMPTALAAGNVTINDFSSNVTNGNVTLLTRFTGNVTGNVTNWQWIFKNVETEATTYSSAKMTTHHNIKKPGVYNVTLAVWGPEGNDTLTKVAYVTANRDNSSLPVADFSASTTSGSAPLNVSFTDNSTGATSWFWKFGDGSISKEKNPTHNYSTAGNYNVILVVNNGKGWSSKTQQIIAQGEGSEGSNLPIADFNADNTSGSVQFTDLSQNADEWNWDFGDGATSTDENPTHAYSSAGNYTVKLTASNEAGDVSKVSTINLRDENIANDNSDSSSGSRHYRSSISGGIGSSNNNVSTSNEVIHVNGTESESTGIEQNNSTVTNVSDNVSVSPELQSNVTETVNDTQSEPETQGLDNGSTAANADTQTSEQTQSSNTSDSNTSGNGNTKSPGFEMIYGVVGLLGVSLYRRR